MFTNMAPIKTEGSGVCFLTWARREHIVSAGVRFSGGGKQECGGAILVVLLLHTVHVSTRILLHPRSTFTGPQKNIFACVNFPGCKISDYPPQN